MESFSKQDVIIFILKSAHKKCNYEQIYSKLQAHLTMSQFMKFIFELRKYDLLKSIGKRECYVITPKGMKYLQIHNELTGQMRPATTWSSRIYGHYHIIFRVASFFKKKNNIFENI